MPMRELFEVEMASKLRRLRDEGATVLDVTLTSFLFFVSVSTMKSAGGSYVPIKPLSRIRCNQILKLNLIINRYFRWHCATWLVNSWSGIFRNR